MTALYYLIGEDVGASPSPTMMNAAFASLGMDASYAPRSVPKARLTESFAALRREGARGANVTIPFKSSIMPLLDWVDEVAAKIGAVNTIAKEGEAYLGFNTDVDGIVGPLEFHGVRRVKAALLIGAGGAARAFCEAASRLGCSSVIVAVRDVQRASRFMRDMKSAFPAMAFSCVLISELRRSNCDILFNASPMGTAGSRLPSEVANALSAGMTVFDAVYRPADTELLSAASKLGCTVVRGHEMLLQQAAAAFTKWTGVPAPIDVMRDALLMTLGVNAA